MAVYKVNISLPPDLVEEIDSTAKDLGMTRSGFVAEASARYIVDIKNLSVDDQRKKDVDRAVKMFRRIGREVPADLDFTAQLRADRQRDAGGRGRG